MRARPPALLVAVLVVVIAVGAATPASAAPSAAPVVSSVQVGGGGAGDLVLATGSGFTPGAEVTVTLVDDTGSAPLATTTVDTAGATAVPAGTRIPDTTAPGSYRLSFGQPDGTTADSPAFTVRAPIAVMPPFLQPGRSAQLHTPFGLMRLAGLANGPGVVRTVAIDGVPATGVRWYSDASTFSNPHLAFAVPADLPVGSHQVRFTQTGPTPFTSTGTVDVRSPVLAVTGTAAPISKIAVDLTYAARDELVDLAVVGAAGDRHADLQFIVTRAADGYSPEKMTVDLSGVSVGTATLTSVSRRNGATATTTFVVDGSTVGSAGLAPGRRVVSADGIIEIVMQVDGNLVLVTYGRYVGWNSRTGGHPGARLAVQSDGNVVIVGTDGRPLWNAGTAGIGVGARFGLDALGNVAVLAASGRQAWSSFTNGGDLELSLTTGHYLFRGQTVFSNLRHGPGGSLAFTMRPDGDLAVSGTYQGTLWSTKTAGHPNAYVSLQSDGNLVVRAPNGTVLWANHAKAAGARIVAQSDGNVVEYAANGRAVWSTKTSVR